MAPNRRFIMLAAAAFFAATPAWAQPSGGGGGQDRQARLTSAESFMPMPTLSVAVVQRGAARGTIVVDMGLDIRDEALRNRARSNEPRLRDALRTALSNYAGAYYRDRTAPDPTTLARLMQTAVDRSLGATGAQVLFTNIIYQR